MRLLVAEVYSVPSSAVAARHHLSCRVWCWRTCHRLRMRSPSSLIGMKGLCVLQGYLLVQILSYKRAVYPLSTTHCTIHYPLHYSQPPCVLYYTLIIQILSCVWSLSLSVNTRMFVINLSLNGPGWHQGHVGMIMPLSMWQATLSPMYNEINIKNNIMKRWDIWTNYDYELKYFYFSCQWAVAVNDVLCRSDLCRSDFTNRPAVFYF